MTREQMIADVTRAVLSAFPERADDVLGVFTSNLAPEKIGPRTRVIATPPPGPLSQHEERVAALALDQLMLGVRVGVILPPGWTLRFVEWCPEPSKVIPVKPTTIE